MNSNKVIKTENDKEQKIKIISEAYFKLLCSVDWADELLIAGLREGLTKFLSNAFINISGRNKYLQADYYSSAALKKINNNDFKGLIYEHMIPKSKYIQRPCEEMARNKNLSLDYIINKLEAYWKISVITAEEDKLLSRKTMPSSWDGKDIFIRYEDSDIELSIRKSN